MNRKLLALTSALCVGFSHASESNKTENEQKLMFASYFPIESVKTDLIDANDGNDSENDNNNDRDRNSEFFVELDNTLDSSNTENEQELMFASYFPIESLKTDVIDANDGNDNENDNKNSTNNNVFFNNTILFQPESQNPKRKDLPLSIEESGGNIKKNKSFHINHTPDFFNNFYADNKVENSITPNKSTFGNFITVPTNKPKSSDQRQGKHTSREKKSEYVDHYNIFRANNSHVKARVKAGFWVLENHPESMNNKDLADFLFFLTKVEWNIAELQNIQKKLSLWFEAFNKIASTFAPVDLVDSLFFLEKTILKDSNDPVPQTFQEKWIETACEKMIDFSHSDLVSSLTSLSKLHWQTRRNFQKLWMNNALKKLENFNLNDFSSCLFSFLHLKWEVSKTFQEKYLEYFLDHISHIKNINPKKISNCLLNDFSSCLFSFVHLKWEVSENFQEKYLEYFLDHISHIKNLNPKKISNCLRSLNMLEWKNSEKLKEKLEEKLKEKPEEKRRRNEQKRY